MQQQVITTTTVSQPVVQSIESNDTRVYHRYSNQSSIVLGSLQIVIGLLCMFFNLAALLLDATHSKISHGFWCGIFFIIAGIFGIKAGVFKTGCFIVTYMIFSIISSVLCVFLLSISSDGVQKDRTEYCYWGMCFGVYSSSSNKETRQAQIAVNAFIVALALAELIFSIWSAVLCCVVVCCGQNTSGAVPERRIVQYINTPSHAQVVYITPAAQAVMDPNTQTYIQPGYIAGTPQLQPVVYPGSLAPPAYNNIVSPGQSIAQPAGLTDMADIQQKTN